MMFMIIGGLIAFIIVAILVIALLGALTSIMPYLIVGAVILGLGYVIILLVKSNNDSPTSSHVQEEDKKSIVELCKSMYDDSGSIKQCIERGGN